MQCGAKKIKVPGGKVFKYKCVFSEVVPPEDLTNRVEKKIFFITKQCDDSMVSRRSDALNLPAEASAV